MKHHDATSIVRLEWQRKKVLLGNTFKNQVREIPETEAFIVPGVTYKYAASCAGRSQQSQAFTDQSFSNTLFLVVWQYRDRAKAMPIAAMAGNSHGGKRYMAYHSCFNLRNQRNNKCVGGSQGTDNKLLRVVAVRAILESGSGDF